MAVNKPICVGIEPVTPATFSKELCATKVSGWLVLGALAYMWSLMFDNLQSSMGNVPTRLFLSAVLNTECETEGEMMVAGTSENLTIRSNSSTFRPQLGLFR
jgi:hypothetical protein